MADPEIGSTVDFADWNRIQLIRCVLALDLGKRRAVVPRPVGHIVMGRRIHMAELEEQLDRTVRHEKALLVVVLTDRIALAAVDMPLALAVVERDIAWGIAVERTVQDQAGRMTYSVHKADHSKERR